QSKGFGLGVVGSERLADRLISRTEHTLAKAGLPVYRSSEASQLGKGFGERLANAMAEVYALGYNRLLVVGNDCPFLRTSHLRAAARLLVQGKNVLGPDRRGGIWLLGLQREDFAPQALADLSWQSASVHAELTNLLPTINDLARLGDLNKVSELRAQWFLLRQRLADLVALVFVTQRIDVLGFIGRNATVDLRLAGRAPPSNWPGLK
ncbi:MAG: DUF2064 domain-containing protein, partial [Bacteroidota bacterium]